MNAMMMEMNAETMATGSVYTVMSMLLPLLCARPDGTLAHGDCVLVLLGSQHELYIDHENLLQTVHDMA